MIEIDIIRYLLDEIEEQEKENEKFFEKYPERRASGYNYWMPHNFYNATLVDNCKKIRKLALKIAKKGLPK